MAEPGGIRVDVPLVEVDIGLFANQVGVTSADTLDLRQGVHDLAFTVDIGVQQTENVLFRICQFPTLVPHF